MATKVTRKSELRELGNAYERWQKGKPGLGFVYGRCSEAKWAAWNSCETEAILDFEGFGLRVISRNTYFFTAGCLGHDPETKEDVFVYFTPTKTWYATFKAIEEAMV